MSSNSSNPDGEDPNPFVAFRRFADEHFAQMLKTMQELPSAIAEIRKSFEFSSDKKTSDPWKSFSDGYERNMNPERRKTEARRGEDAFWRRQQERQERQGNKAGDQEDEFFWFPFVPFEKFETLFPAWHGHKRCSGGAGPWQPELRWARESPYSPLSLEEDEQLQRSNVNWRDAFEDLLELDQQKSLPDRTNAASTAKSRDDWIAGLFTKRLLRPDIPARHRIFDDSFEELIRQRFLDMVEPQTSRRDHDEDEASRQLDEMLLLHSRTSEAMHRRHHAEHPDQHSSRHISSTRTTTTTTQQDGQDVGSLLSTVTTVEQRPLADGGVETVRTVKKKFSNGGESMEEERTVRPPEPKARQPAQKQLPPPAAPASSDKDSKDDGKKEKGNWFWSR